MELKGKIVNFLGDSITEGCGTSGSSAIYLSLLKERYSLKAANNYGISGTRFARQHAPTDDASFDQNYCSRVDSMEKDADIVVVFGGTNDFGHGDAPIGSFSDRTPDTFCGACHTLMIKLIERFPRSLIVFMTPLHRLNEGNPRGDNKPEYVGTLKTYVNIIRRTAEQYSLPVLDLYAMSGIQPSVPVIRELYCPDGLHPNDAGHSIIADRLAGFLLSL